MEIEMEEIIVDEEIEIEDIELDVIKMYPEGSDTLNVIPTEENQQINGLFKVVNVEKIPEKYVVPQVEGEMLLLSRGVAQGGVLGI